MHTDKKSFLKVIILLTSGISSVFGSLASNIIQFVPANNTVSNWKIFSHKKKPKLIKII